MITLPNRNIQFSQSNGSVFPMFQNQQLSHLPNNVLKPRAPIVHCFICDYANTKVKIVTEQFIETLLKNGIKVYAEKFLTHQPGYQVCAASLNTQADFFFQIHSKTAGPGHVRLYHAGQPKRMTKEDAVSAIWTLWRLRCGSLNKDEIELISNEKITQLLRDFANVDVKDIDIATVQLQGRELIDRGMSVRSVLTKLQGFEVILQNGKQNINSANTISTDWNFELGVMLQKIIQVPIITGLSQPLKNLLISIIEQSISKVRIITNIFERYAVSSPPMIQSQEIPIDNMNEIPIAGEPRGGDGSSWKMMIESADEDKFGSMQIASYGDGQSIQSIDRIMTPVFMLDDY